MKALDQFDIKGRSAIVTGAASGIGLCYAEAMAEAVAVLMQESSEAVADRTRKGRDYAAKCRPSQLIPAWEELLASLVESRRKA